MDIDHVIQWTDRCGSQYKSRRPFANISYALADFQCTLDRHFYGSRHGKGPSDGESAVVKHHAVIAVTSGAVAINSAEDLFSLLCQQQVEQAAILPVPALPTITFHDSICQNLLTGKHKTLKGTRALRRVKCVEPQVIPTHTLSCPGCQSGVGNCINEHIVGAPENNPLSQN